MLRLAFYILILVLVLSFFGVSLQHLIEAPATQSNFAYVLNLLQEAWDDIVAQVLAVWHMVF